MDHDVYICYDEKNKDIGEEIYRLFEENNIKSWIKSKHFSSNDSVDKITNMIEESKCFLLILSKYSNNTNYIITETDIAFSRNIPIIVFKLDDSKLDGNLEFILENQTVIPSFPYTKKQLDTLVRKTSQIIGKPKDKVKIDSKFVVFFEALNPKRKENKIKKYVKIAIPIVVVLILIYFFVIVPTGQKTTDDGIFSMNVTKVDVNGLNYIVRGESYNMPADSSKYFMNIKFFDSEDNQVYEVNSTADEFKSGIIWEGDLHSDNATHVVFKLTDLKGNELSKQDYAING